jgi:cation-transporting ATPase E
MNRGVSSVAVVSAARASNGLSSQQVAERCQVGLTNDQGKQPTRSVAQILRANVLTRFNAILLALLVVIIIVGPLQDALFGLILVANSGIGIIQELRAKRTLDQLSVLNAPTARAVRDGATVTVPAGQVVLDDVLELRSGDQVVVDGQVLRSAGLEIDESLLSGEADPIGKEPGDEVMSGSFVVAGSGRVVATKVGGESYAAKLTTRARGYSPARSEIRDAINRVLIWISWLLVIVGPLLLITQLRSGQTTAEALRGSVAGLSGMVPEGLVLLTSVAMAVGVVRLAARRVLVQDLPAIEGLARVDVICCDKTGTLTQGSMHVVGVDPLGDGDQMEAALGALAVADPRRNATMAALADRFADPGWRPVSTTAFSSARKWSAASFDGHGQWLVGAPEMLLARESDRPVLEQAGDLAADGYRVLLLASSPAPVDDENRPDRVEPVALVTLAEQIRPDAESTLAYFASQDVSVRVISGDHPATVGAIARRLGLSGADRPLDARNLPDDDEPGGAARLADAVGESTVIGRVAPHQKQAIVAALQRLGHVVAMTGDGVNDVLALKNCDVGIAMGSGTPASRGVARLVLLDDKFATLPAVVAEGRRLIGNVDRVSRLFLTKACYVLLIALAITAAAAPFPFYPRHLTVISTLSIGVPAFFLALAPNADRIAPGFLSRALRFAVPAGLMIAAAAVSSFLITRDLGHGLGVARTGATVVATGLSLAVLATLARPVVSWRGAMVVALAASFAGLFAWPWLRHQLALTVLPAEVLWLSLALAAAGFGVLLVLWPVVERVSWLRPAENAARQRP